MLQELLSLLPHWRGAMVKADFEAPHNFRCSALKFLGFKVEDLGRLGWYETLTLET